MLTPRRLRISQQVGRRWRVVTQRAPHSCGDSAGQEMAEDNEERHRGAKAEQAFSGQEAYIPLASGSQTGMLQNSRTVWFFFFDHRLLVFSPRVPQIQ